VALEIEGETHGDCVRWILGARVLDIGEVDSTGKHVRTYADDN